MITRMDKDVGRILDHLKKLKIADKTLVLFTSDNGPHNEARHNPERFNPSGPLRGMKRTLTEGGIRVPTIAWWPKTVTPGSRCDQPLYFVTSTATRLRKLSGPLAQESILVTSWPLPAIVENYRDLPCPRILTVFPFFPPSKGKRTNRYTDRKSHG